MAVIVRQVGRPSKIGKAIEIYLSSVAENIMTQQRAQDMVASGESLRSHVVTIKKNPDEGEYQASDYYQFLMIGQGRKPGKFPRLDKIRSWIAARGIRPDGNTTLQQLIFLFSRKISELGTAIFEGSKGIDLDAAVDEPLDDFLDVVGDTVANEVANQIVKSFEKIPNTQTR